VRTHIHIRTHKKAVEALGEKRQWKPWEKVISDSSGKFRVMSLQRNRYYSVFACARSGRKLYFAHKKKSHYPMVYLKFLARTGRFPKLLVSDQAGEILSKALGSRLAAQVTHIDPVPKDEHSKIGSAKRAIDEIDRMVAASLLNSNIPKCYWDIVCEHCSMP